MSNLDDYRGRLLARAFHDELEKLSMPIPTPPPTAMKGGKGVPSAGKPTGGVPTTGSFSPKPLSTNLGGAGAKATTTKAAPVKPVQTVPASSGS